MLAGLRMLARDDMPIRHEKGSGRVAPKEASRRRKHCVVEQKLQRERRKGMWVDCYDGGLLCLARVPQAEPRLCTPHVPPQSVDGRLREAGRYCAATAFAFG